MAENRLSFVIPARNEEALIGEVVEAILRAVARASGISRDDLWLPDSPFEVLVADDGSEDATPAIVARFGESAGVRLVPCGGRSSAAARNTGAKATSGRVLCFVDADTIVPETAVERILELHEDECRCLVLYRLASREPGIRSWVWWSFWGLARRLPLNERSVGYDNWSTSSRVDFDGHTFTPYLLIPLTEFQSHHASGDRVS
jgi:glycosyltransferase involved in cell wall biosynthesis